MDFFYGIYKQGNEVLLAICDDDIVDKVFRCTEKNIKIDLKTGEASHLGFKGPPRKLFLR